MTKKQILIDEATVRRALNVLDYYAEPDGFDLNTANYAAEELRQALSDSVEQPAPAQPLTPGFAGVTLWLGDARVTQIVTEAQITYERETGRALTEAAQKCLDIYASARGTKGGA